MTGTKKFCSFCAEPHLRRKSTCSEECSKELIRTEFEENGDLERRCLWCPVRGDLAPFVQQNLCSNCAIHRQRLGACRSCGGAYGTGFCCHRCTKPEIVLERTKVLRAFILFDVETKRARRFFSQGGAIQVPRGYAAVIEVTRARFERPSTTTWTDPSAYVLVSALEGGSTSSRAQKLKLFQRAGQRFTAKAWAGLYSDCTGAGLESSLRHFERAKVMIQALGVSITTVPDGQQTLYEFDENAAEALLAYYKTVLKNKKMGYYW